MNFKNPKDDAKMSSFFSLPYYSLNSMGWLELARFTQRSVRMVVLKSLLEEKLNMDPVSLFPHRQPIFHPTPEDVSISYLPLAHMFERVVQVSVLCARWEERGFLTCWFHIYSKARDAAQSRSFL